MVLTELIKTYIRTLVRSRGAMVSVLAAPLLLMVVAAIAFDSQSTYNLHVGAYAEAYSKDANQFLDNLAKNQFGVTRYSDSTQCLNALKQGVTVTCLIFAKQNDEVSLYIDYSKINLVDSLMSLMAQKLSEQSTAAGANITAELVQRMEDARTGLDESRPIIVSLTTHNEQSTQKVDALIMTLRAMSLKLNQSLELAVLESKDNKFAQWLSSLSKLANEMLIQYSSTMDLVKNELDDATLPESQKQKLFDLLEKGKSSLESLKDKVSIAGQISEKDLNNLLQMTQETLKTLINLQAQIDNLEGFRTEGVEQLRDVRGSLDHNLLQFIQLQTALNKIDKSVSGVQIENPGNLLAPFDVKVQPITTAKKRFHLLYPNLLALVIMFSSILLGSSLMVMHIRSPAMRRIKMAGIPLFWCHAAMWCAVLAMVGAQVALISVVGIFYFGIDLFVVLPQALLVSMIISSAFAAGGLVLGAVFRRESTAILAGVIISGLFMILSDVILPLEAFPMVLREILLYNPFVAGAFALKRLILFHAPLSFVGYELLVLVVYTLGCAVLLSMLFSQGAGDKPFKPWAHLSRR